MSGREPVQYTTTDGTVIMVDKQVVSCPKQWYQRRVRGYDWYAHELPEGLIITEAYRVSVQNPPGASGTRIITVTAADGVVGEHLVELHYKRVWEKSTPPSKVFRVRLVVL
eukprot:TRINITY_DN2231_c0_g1_i1.p1 TRINITY_DN2231_c0_g1~~TRINITY_DN2231_c0_g1_i1.p1  ORF type:complete len:111 (+),score=35.25 TRINITY_DN2231_c0_g1_i1:1-333(+)